MKKTGRTMPPIEMANILATIGLTVRRLRTDKAMTLQALSKGTGLSVSMLSLIERGKASPSIGTLVVLASVLGVEMAALLGADRAGKNDDIVSRAKKQKIVQTNDGVTRRIVKTDNTHSLEIAINEYKPGTASSPAPMTHKGFEYGIVLQGKLQITLNEVKHALSTGDAISYPSTHPHRIANPGKSRARALWINLRRN